MTDHNLSDTNFSRSLTGKTQRITRAEKTINALQETLNQQPPENMDKADLPSVALQDIINTEQILPFQIQSER